MHSCEIELFVIDGITYHPPLGKCKICGALHRQHQIGPSLAFVGEHPVWDYVAEPAGNNFPDDPRAVITYQTPT